MSQHPEMAKEWQKMTPDHTLPERVKPKKNVAKPESRSGTEADLDFESLTRRG